MFSVMFEKSRPTTMNFHDRILSESNHITYNDPLSSTPFPLYKPVSHVWKSILLIQDP